MKEIPSTTSAYKRTPTFDENTIPVGLLKAHQTKAGTWGKIVVLHGRLLYRILEPDVEEHTIDRESHGVVEPEVLHEVTPQGSVQFYVEFYR